MTRSFTLLRSGVVDATPDALRTRVAGLAGSEDEAASILRSLERLGTDPTIHSFEMTASTVQRAYRGASPVVWSVRAVRD